MAEPTAKAVLWLWRRVAKARMHYPWLHPLIGLGAPMIKSRQRVVDWMERIASRPAVERGMKALA